MARTDSRDELSVVRWLMDRYYVNERKHGHPEAIRMSQKTVDRIKAEFAEVVGKRLANCIRHHGPLFAMRLEIKRMRNDYIQFVWY